MQRWLPICRNISRRLVEQNVESFMLAVDPRLELISADHLESCLREIDDSGIPIPFPASHVYGGRDSARLIAESARQQVANQATSGRFVQFEIGKSKPDEVRCIHRISLPEYLRYHALSRRLAVLSGPLKSSVSSSFRPNLGGGPEIWEDNERGKYGRFLDHEDELIRCASDAEWAVEQDVREFFPTIQHEKLRDKVHDLYVPLFERSGEDLEELFEVETELLRLLGGWAGTDIGIPQGQTASFFFAELIFLPLDRMLNRNGISVRRFVDGYTVCGDSEDHISAIQEKMDAYLAEHEFEWNDSKHRSGPAAALLHRILKSRRKREKLLNSLRDKSPTEALNIALDALRCQLYSDSFEPSWERALITTIRKALGAMQAIPAGVAAAVSECLDVHTYARGDATQLWRSALAPVMDDVSIQEVVGDKIIRGAFRNDTDMAFLCGLFAATERIHSGELRSKLASVFEEEAQEPPDVLFGAAIARTGKALRAAQRHGAGNNVLVDVYSKANYSQEMRRYTAMAASALPLRHRAQFIDCQRSTADTVEERIAISFFEARGEPLDPDRMRFGFHWPTS